MPTVVKTYTFDTDSEEWNSSLLWVNTDGSDLSGSADPGCMHVVAGNGGHTILDISQHIEGMTEVPNRWEYYGVPAGQIVTGVSVRLRFKKVDQSPPPSAALLKFNVRTAGGDIATAIINANVLSVDGAWHTYSGGSSSNVPSWRGASDTIVFFDVEVTGGAGGTGLYDGWVDTIEITMTYGPPGITIDPPTATIYVDETQLFTANMIGDWSAPDGGSLSDATGLTSTWSP